MQSSSTIARRGGGTQQPHANEALHVAVPVVPQESEQGWVAFGLHAPAQLPFEQVYWHAVPLCHVPVIVHDCGVTPSLAHWAEPGTQTPAQLPLLQT